MTAAVKVIGTPQEPAGRETGILVAVRKSTDGTYQPLLVNAAGELITAGGGGGGGGIVQQGARDAAAQDWFVKTPDVTASGTLTAAGQTVVLALDGRQGAAIQVTGTFNMDLGVELSIDGGVTYGGVHAWDRSSFNWVIPLVVGNYIIPFMSGFTHMRVRVNTFTSGSVSIVIRATAYPVMGDTFTATILSSPPPTIAVIGGEDKGTLLIDRLRMTTLDPDAGDVGAIVRDPRTADIFNKIRGNTVTTADGLVTAPAANALIAEVTSLAAGDHEVFVHMGTDDTTLTGRFLLVVWTNSANAVKDNLSLIPAPGFGTFYVPRLTVALNDKIRILAGNVAALAATRYQGHISVRLNA